MIDALMITGTDTGVGKTHVACALAHALRRRGLRVGVQKPCETGVDAPWPPLAPVGDVLPPGSDADLLARASECDASLVDILPAAFPLPAAPSVSARHACSSIDLDAMTESFMRIRAAHDITLVEGAGGLVVPITPEVSYLTLAERLDLPLLIVARTGLGTLNHTRLTELAARAAGRRVLGVVLNSADVDPSPSDRANLEDLARTIEAPLVAELRFGVCPDASEAVDVMAPLVDQLTAD